MTETAEYHISSSLPTPTQLQHHTHIPVPRWLWLQPGAEKRDTWACVSRANMCSCSACVLMNSAVRFHIIIQPRTRTLSPLNSCLVPPLLPSKKSLLSHHCGSWCCGRPGLGGRVGKILQTRHEQMPETLDCRADHRGRASHWVLMRVQVYVCLICVW